MFNIPFALYVEELNNNLNTTQPYSNQEQTTKYPTYNPETYFQSYSNQYINKGDEPWDVTE